MSKLLKHTKRGLYCEIADVYIDPNRKVDKAIITHGHSDHARKGHGKYLSATSSVNILKQRLGKNITISGYDFGEKTTINGVTFSFHPAGHIGGSAQIRVEYKGEVWGVSGDYKIEDDGLAEPFEPITCHHFITECTFGLPIYQWMPQKSVFDDINSWWANNAANGVISILTAYSLGKAQRLVYNLDHEIGPIFCHYTIDQMNEVFRASGFDLPETKPLALVEDHTELLGGIVIAPGANKESQWLRNAPAVSLGMASGWMMSTRGRKSRGANRGFILSDHCDWEGLLTAIKATGAENIYPTHGPSHILSQYLNENGWNARPIESPLDHRENEDD